MPHKMHTTEELQSDDLDLLDVTDELELHYLIGKYSYETGVRVGSCSTHEDALRQVVGLLKSIKAREAQRREHTQECRSLTEHEGIWEGNVRVSHETEGVTSVCRRVTYSKNTGHLVTYCRIEDERGSVGGTAGVNPAAALAVLVKHFGREQVAAAAMQVDVGEND